jgi:transposase
MGKVVRLSHERVDEVPLLIGLMQRLQLPQVADRHLGKHHFHQGLSPGTLLMVWLAYLLAYADHRKAAVQAWAQRYPVLLQRLLGVCLRPTEFTDDRLGLLLRRLSDPASWQALEADLWQSTLSVYALPQSVVRLDSTSTYGYHARSPDGLLQLGRSKDHRPDLPQLLVMAAAVEPAGHLLGVDVHPGNRADDVCYLPLIERVRQTVGQAGVLWVGDCKMAALGIRAAVAAAGDYYLMPLPRSGEAAALIDGWVEAVITEAAAWELLWDGPTLLGAGKEFERELEATLPTETGPRQLRWTERVQVFRSLYLMRQQSDHLDSQLARATAALWALTPPRRSGKRLYQEEVDLREAVEKVLTHYRVEGLLRVRWETERPARPLRRRLGITAVERDEPAIEARRMRLGWRVQGTNAPPERLTFPGCVAQYRGGWCLERTFHLLKDRPLGIRPLFVRRDDQLRGLTHLLTLGLRLLTLIEVELRREVRQTGELWTGLYEGQPQRATANPTATQVLGAIARAGVTLTRVERGREQHWHLTPLPPLLERTLACLGFSPSLYQRLIENST